MRNISLKSKIAILVSVLTATVLAVAIVGAWELRRNNVQMRQLVDRNGRAIELASQIRVGLLAAVRREKNAVLASDEIAAAKFAMDVEESADQVEALSPELNSLIGEIGGVGDGFAVFRREWENLRSNQAEVLRLAVLNTNRKAFRMLAEDVATRIESLDRIMAGVELRAMAQPRVEGTSPTASGSSDRRERAAELRLAFAQLISRLYAHINADDEALMNELDGEIAAMLSSIDASLETLQAFAEDRDRLELGQAAMEARELRREVAEIQSLSRQNTNVKAVALTSTTTVTLVNKCDAALAALLDNLGRAAQAKRDTAQTTFYRAVAITAGTAIVGIAVALILGRLIARSVTGPVAQGVEVAHALAQGDLTRRLRLTQRDEIGQLTCAIDQAAENFAAIVAEIHDVAVKIGGSAGELSAVSHQLLSQSEEMSTQAGYVAGGTEQMTANINTMAAAAEEMSMNVASISSASEEISVNVGAISSSATHTSSNVDAVVEGIQDAVQSFESVAGDARQGALTTAKAVNLATSATTTMHTLDRAAGEINKVTEMIKLIAMQTNLLALNATIEAASAGEAGKGFAVVANEIKELANQSGKAAEDIARMIEGIQTNTRGAVAVIQEVAATIQEVNTANTRISQATEEQTQLANASAVKLDAAGKGVGQIAQSITEVAKGANDMSRNASEAAKAASDVSYNASEAARAVRDIASNIRGVSQATRDNTASAQQVNQAAGGLQGIAANLERLVARFRLTSDER